MPYLTNYTKMLNISSWAPSGFCFYTSSSIRISNNLLGGYFCNVPKIIYTWLPDKPEDEACKNTPQGY